jgi:hypothetical protein
MIDTADERSNPSFTLLWLVLGCIVILVMAISILRRPSPATRLIILNDIVTSIRSSGVDTQSVEIQMIAESDSIDTKGLKTQKQVAEKAYRMAIATGTKWIRKNETFKSKKAEYEQSSPREWQKLDSELDDLCRELFSAGLMEVARRSTLKKSVIARKPSHNIKPVKRWPVSSSVRPQRSALVKPNRPTSKSPSTTNRTRFSER